MELSDKLCGQINSPEVYRVIDDGDCILTTMDARKALIALNELIEKYDITNCWADVEVLR